LTDTETQFWTTARHLQGALAMGAATRVSRASLAAFMQSGRELLAAIERESSGMASLEAWHAKEIQSLQDAALFKLFAAGDVDAVLREPAVPRLCEQYFLVLRFLVAHWLRQRLALGLAVGDSQLLPPSARAAAAIGGYVWGYY
jgi:hypothetical protein